MSKIPVAVLGATGAVGQKFVELLTNHPWFEIAALAASERSQGKAYKEAMNWMMSSPLSSEIASKTVQSCIPNLPCRVVFSGLDSDVAGEIEQLFAEAGYAVISNSKNHRMDPRVPLVIPEVNSDHLELIKEQKFPKGGFIVTNPNCSVIGLATAIKPLDEGWEIEQVQVTTLQAISGAGYPGVASLDIIDNVIPFISGEEAKVESEPLKILGKRENDQIHFSSMKISAQCNRVAVVDGHIGCVSVKLKKAATQDEIINAWLNFRGEPQALELPTAPKQPILYFTEEKFPQPKLHRNIEGGMTVSIGRLRPCPLLDWKFVYLSHNTVRGAAGCAILNGELLLKKGYLK